MKLALVYDPQCPKLTPEAYSQTYRDMFLSLFDVYEETQEITHDCSAQDIEADHIVFFDIHSSHHITIDGIAKHKATKFEYFNDPFQPDSEGQYNNGPKFKKLGAEARSRRANERGVEYVICPYQKLYYQFIHPYFEGELIWFPVAPRPRVQAPKLLKNRRPEVLANGHTFRGWPGFRLYNFRQWAHQQKDVTVVPHTVQADTPSGGDYQTFLSQFAAALALCDTHPCPKYMEIPLAGCLCLAQYQFEYRVLGFQDGHTHIYVTRKNFLEVVKDVKRDPAAYQAIANNGRSLVLNHWTARHFAERIRNAK